MSSKPRRDNWAAFVKSEDALTAIDPSCPLSTVARASFTGISTKHWGPTRVRPGVVTLLEPQKSKLGMSGGDSPMEVSFVPRLSQFVKLLGNYLVEMQLGIWLASTTTETMEPLLQTLKDDASALRRLDIREVNSNVANSFLRGTHGRLHELIVNKWAAPGIGRHCHGLRKLVLKSAWGDCSGNETKCNVCSGPWGFEDLLCAVGPTLESLEIRMDPELSAKDIELVRALCPNLTSIFLPVRSDEAKSACADLLCSCGSQLQYSNLDIMPVDLCKRIVATCKTCAVH